MRVILGPCNILVKYGNYYMLSVSLPGRYKFNWSPRGVILNVLSPARWLEGGSVREIQPGGSLLDNMQEMDFLPGFNLEGQLCVVNSSLLHVYI